MASATESDPVNTLQSKSLATEHGYQQDDLLPKGQKNSPKPAMETVGRLLKGIEEIIRETLPSTVDWLDIRPEHVEHTITKIANSHPEFDRLTQERKLEVVSRVWTSIKSSNTMIPPEEPRSLGNISQPRSTSVAMLKPMARKVLARLKMTPLDSATGTDSRASSSKSTKDKGRSTCEKSDPSGQ